MTNGGAQRGHSVISDVGDFTFKHFGSGTCYNADSYYCQYFILNPMQFVKEYRQLRDKIPLFNNIKFYRHVNCKWSTPFDQMFNLAIEASRGAERHGSCGMGIWETVLRYSKTITYTLSDFMNLTREDKVKYLQNVKNYFNIRMKELNVKLPKELIEPWNSDFLIEHFIRDCKFIASTVIPVSSITDISNNYQEIIFENGQGLLLTSSIFDDHTTPSNTGCHDAMDIIINELHIPRENVTVHYITRPYLTRHGNGSLIGETDKNHIAGSVPEDRTNHYNKTQGRFRYAGLDIHDLLNRVKNDYQAMHASGLKIEVTHCDEMDRVNEFEKVFGQSAIHTFESPKI